MALSANDPRPQHQQIADDLRTQISSGELAAGDRLPTIKDLMARYGVYNQTVQAAFKILQTERLTEGVPGRGTFVRTDVDLATLTHGSETAEPSPDYVALRDQIGLLASEVGDLKKRLVEIEELVAEALSSSTQVDSI